MQTISDGQESVDILLVDDRVEDLAAMKSVLERPGYNIVTARSGPEALRRLLDHDFAVILLDVRMPVMDGYELARLIKQRDRSAHTPIIFLTAAGMEDVRQVYQGYSAGAVDCLAKPIDPAVLGPKVAIFVDLFRKDRKLERQAAALRDAEHRERELALAELRLSAERRYRNLAEAIPNIVWTALPDGSLDFCNFSGLSYTGLELAQMRGNGWLKVVHDNDREHCERAWREAILRRDPFELECRLRRRDGTYRWHLCRAFPEINDHKELIGWLGTFTDFEDLNQAIRARDEFLSIASHELRTPLTALKLRVQGLQHGNVADDKLRRGLDAAARQTERLERLLDALLDVSRITTGHLVLEPEEIDLSQVLGEVLERVRPEAVQAGSALEIELEPSIIGCWDRLRIEQVLTNLLSNAMKYGGAKPIRVELSADASHARLAVSDQGIGIASEDVERIFDRFERAWASGRCSGLGMGLYITKQIVDAHGGRIRVESRPNQGSRFTVELPLWADAKSQTEAPVKQSLSARNGRTDWSKSIDAPRGERQTPDVS